jgi:hypothetical protein
MEVLIIKIKNNTDEVQSVDLDKLTIGVELETEVKDMTMVFGGFKIVTGAGCKVDMCFYNKSININGIDVVVSDWFSMAQHSNDFVNIKLLIESFDNILFKLNARKKIEIYLPIDKCNLEFYKNLKIETK